MAYVAAAVFLVLIAVVGFGIGHACARRKDPGSTAAFSTGTGTWGVPPSPANDLIHTAAEVAPKAERTWQLMEFLAHRDPLFEPARLRLGAEQSFLLVQECWQKGDYEPLRAVLLPAIWAEHVSQLRAMRTNGERNVLDGLRVDRLEFVHLDCPADADAHELTALITFTAASHYVELLTGRFRRGSLQPTRFQEFWVLRRQGEQWRLAAIERSHASTRLGRPNHVEELTEEQVRHAQTSIAL
jgi:predicted lipid-binding transport protein (Tim44 family)